MTLPPAAAVITRLKFGGMRVAIVVLPARSWGQIAADERLYDFCRLVAPFAVASDDGIRVLENARRKRGGGGTSASAPARIISPSYDRYDRPVENSIRGRVPGPDHLSIKIVIRFAELHHHEHLWFIRQEPKIGKFY